MQQEFTIKISGEAGQGMQTIGQALCAIYRACGLNIFANQDYMSRIRGGNNFFQLRVADTPVYASRHNADILVALDKASVDIHKAYLNTNGRIVLDKKKFGITGEQKVFFDVPMYAIAMEKAASEIFVNSVACGVLAAMTGVEFVLVAEAIKAIFRDKSEEIIKKNIEVAQAGYDFVAKSPRFEPSAIKKKDKPAAELLLNGNEAIALGAIRAGCKFYSAYPMTPSTSIMDTLAHYARGFNIIVEQAEDEIAAINMVIGASFAGVRAMTATSGGGFSLMVEGLSLAAMTETPVVIVDAQRPAPATGFPTRTEQGDLGFLIHAGHGEFARLVYAPGTIEEAFYLTVKAFNMAEKYQIPVLIMTDQYLADSYRNIGVFDTGKARVIRYIIPKQDSGKIQNYKRYAFTESGVSPRAIPSWINEPIYADSDEHTEEGHITEDAAVRIEMVKKRLHRKLSGLGKETEKPTAFNAGKADVMLVGFGSTFGLLREVTAMIKKTGFLHLSQLWPFPEKETLRLLKTAKRIITVENNASGQLAGLIRRQTGIKPDASILKFDGRPFDIDTLREEIKEEL